MIFGQRRRNIEVELESLKCEVYNLRDRYWTLYHKYSLLLDYLGVVETEQKAKTFLAEKGGPERGGGE